MSGLVARIAETLEEHTACHGKVDTVWYPDCECGRWGRDVGPFLLFGECASAHADHVAGVVVEALQPAPQVGMDISESDRALVVAEEKLDAIRELLRLVPASDGAEELAADIRAVLDAGDQ